MRPESEERGQDALSGFPRDGSNSAPDRDSLDVITPRDGRFEDPGEIVWYTISEAARMCHRSEKTIGNLISQHALPVRRGWTVARRIRRRRIMLPPLTIRRLLALTLFRERQQ
jgi:hypothetical protein